MITTNNNANFVLDESLEQFSKGKKTEKNKERVAVMYTRVSTKDQADHNHSLDTQKRLIEEFAQRNNIIIESSFGGTHESAKSDERKEFQRMLKYVRQRRNISHILVATLDRFSRTGGGAIKLSDDLERRGVRVLAVTQAADTSTISGRLQQNIGFIFSNYDNEIRRERAINGLRDALLRGQPAGAIPVGYEKGIVNGQIVRVINEKGRILKNAFIWKANENLSNDEIATRLGEHGLKIRRQNLSTIFRNPFYCGLLAHELLDGKIIRGVHEPLISIDLFKRVNGIISKNPKGWKHKCAHDEVPLKGLLKCPKCHDGLTGYLASKRQVWYYKCRHKGCKVNISANKANETFIQVLNNFELKHEFRNLFELLLLKELGVEAETAKNQIKSLNIHIADLREKRENLESRYVVTGDINEEMFKKYDTKISIEIQQATMQLEKIREKSSNIEKDVKLAFDFATNLSGSWLSSDYFKKQQLQKVLFPAGITYFKENGRVRTEKTNNLFLWITRNQQDNSEKKIGIPQLNLGYADIVEP